MSNGLGAGLFAVTFVAILAGLALLAVLATIVSVAFRRQTGRFPALLRYPVVAIGIGALGVSVFGTLVVYEDAPAAAGIFLLLGVLPLLVASTYVHSTTDLGRIDLVVTTVMAWGLPFLLGVVLAVGVMSGINSVLDLTTLEARQMGVPWIALAVGGIGIVLGTIALGHRIGRMVRSSVA